MSVASVWRKYHTCDYTTHASRDVRLELEIGPVCATETTNVGKCCESRPSPLCKPVVKHLSPYHCLRSNWINESGLRRQTWARGTVGGGIRIQTWGCLLGWWQGFTLGRYTCLLFCCCHLEVLNFWMRGHVFLFCSGLVWVWEQGGLSGLGVARLTAILPPKLIFCPIYHLAAHLHWYFPLNLCILNNPFLKKIIHLAALGLCCCPWAFFSCGCPSLERGLSNCGAQAQAACGIFPEQGSNLCPLCWHADS